MTTLEKLGEIILKFKQGKVTADKFKPNAALVADLGLDSLDFSELLALTEDAFKLQISLDDAKQMKTLGDVVRYIDQHRSA